MKTELMRATLAIVLLLSFQLALAALFKWQVPETNRDMIIYMLGQLSGMVTTALVFYFGTSKSSQDKNAVISNMTDNVASGKASEVEQDAEAEKRRLAAEQGES
jgi:hypothetical protein